MVRSEQGHEWTFGWGGPRKKQLFICPKGRVAFREKILPLLLLFTFPLSGAPVEKSEKKTVYFTLDEKLFDVGQNRSCKSLLHRAGEREKWKEKNRGEPLSRSLASFEDLWPLLKWTFNSNQFNWWVVGVTIACVEYKEGEWRAFHLT